jgi:D-aminopeptidase
MPTRALLVACCLLLPTGAAKTADPEVRPRLRDWGIAVGILPTGPNNAITDVSGVRVGQVTITRDRAINTGVTVVLPHDRNIFREKVPAAVVVGNGFGKLTGALQVNELGELESPVVLSCTLCVGKAWDATAGYLLSLPGNEEVRSVNPVVGETNDGILNDIRARPIREEDVLKAIREARTGPVEEGSVGAGRGTVAFGFKGGIGTSSRRLPQTLGGYALGVLVQTNFGGVLTIVGAPVGQALGQFYLQGELNTPKGDGSIMIVVATDAPMDHRLLQRLGRRALLGVGRTGSPMTNGSGDFVVAFSTSRAAPLSNESTSPLFQAAVEATEEAIYNSLLKATTVRRGSVTVEPLPLEKTREILKRHGVLH